NTVAKPSRSRRLLAQSQAAQWRSATSDDDSRAYLQTRMTLYSKLMFWSIVALLVFLAAMYRTYPRIEPRNQDIVFIGAAVLLGIMAILWRVFLLRRTLSFRALYGLDLVYATGIGGAFALGALLAKDFRPAGYAALM